MDAEHQNSRYKVLAAYVIKQAIDDLKSITRLKGNHERFKKQYFSMLLEEGKHTKMALYRAKKKYQTARNKLVEAKKEAVSALDILTRDNIYLEAIDRTPEYMTRELKKLNIICEEIAA